MKENWELGKKKTHAAGYLNGKPTQNNSKQRSENVRQKLLNGFEKQSVFFKNSNCVYGMCQLTWFLKKELFY